MIFFLFIFFNFELITQPRHHRLHASVEVLSSGVERYHSIDTSSLFEGNNANVVGALISSTDGL